MAARSDRAAKVDSVYLSYASDVATAAPTASITPNNASAPVSRVAAALQSSRRQPAPANLNLSRAAGTSNFANLTPSQSSPAFPAPRSNNLAPAHGQGNHPVHTAGNPRPPAFPSPTLLSPSASSPHFQSRSAPQHHQQQYQQQPPSFRSQPGPRPLLTPAHPSANQQSQAHSRAPQQHSQQQQHVQSPSHANHPKPFVLRGGPPSPMSGRPPIPIVQVTMPEAMHPRQPLSESQTRPRPQFQQHPSSPRGMYRHPPSPSGGMSDNESDETLVDSPQDSLLNSKQFKGPQATFATPLSSPTLKNLHLASAHPDNDRLMPATPGRGGNRDFWKRFSTVVHQHEEREKFVALVDGTAKKEGGKTAGSVPAVVPQRTVGSEWLDNQQHRQRNYRIAVGIVAACIILAIAGGLGYHFVSKSQKDTAATVAAASSSIAVKAASTSDPYTAPSSIAAGVTLRARQFEFAPLIPVFVPLPPAPTSPPTQSSNGSQLAQQGTFVDALAGIADGKKRHFKQETHQLKQRRATSTRAYPLVDAIIATDELD